MQIVTRRPDRGYLDNWLWVPRGFVDVESTKRALTHELKLYGGQSKFIYLWKEAEHHLLLPRAFWHPGNLPFPVVDCRPRNYPHVPFKSRIQLDHLPQELNGVIQLLPTGLDVQARSMSALLNNPGGILQLACVAGDTKLSLNRGGKGFKMSIAKACERIRGKGRYTWDAGIPTYIRSCVGDRIGLNKVVTIINRGRRTVRQLKLADGKVLKATDDHEILTTEGYRALGQLQAGDEVITDGVRAESSRKKKLAYKRIGGFDHHPYARYQSRTHVVEEHRAVMEAHLNGLTLNQFRERCRYGTIEGLCFIDPAKHHVHHKDENIRNNRLSNLEALPAAEHLAKHRPGSKAFGKGELVPVRIQAVDNYGEEEVYDVVCEAPHHNFVASGVVVHNCGKGKTVIALDRIARGQAPAIVMLDNTNLLYQWKSEAEELLDIPGGIGIIGEGKKEWKKALVLATYHSIANWSDTIPEEVRRWFAQVFWDEGHHVSAPTFAKTAPVFYGNRYSLTATPERDDGMHIIAKCHIGDVLYKDLTPTMRPAFAFTWTGLSVDLRDPTVAAQVMDVNQEVHTSKVYSYFGQWQERLETILKICQEAYVIGRKVLVLSNSVGEVVNLYALWTYSQAAVGNLYTDIPTPTPQDIGETLNPVELTKKAFTQLEKAKKKLEKQLERAQKKGNQKDAAIFEGELTLIAQAFKQHNIHKKLKSELDKRQKKYIAALLEQDKSVNPSAGFLSYEVPPKLRQEFIETRPVNFAITKYGKEGLDSQALDTIVLSSLFSSANGLQQLMGRPTRPMPGKKNPLIIALVDNVGQCIGMNKKLQSHLRSWPKEEGGPYEPILVNHPPSWTYRKSTALLTDLLLQ